MFPLVLVAFWFAVDYYYFNSNQHEKLQEILLIYTNTEKNKMSFDQEIHQDTFEKTARDLLDFITRSPSCYHVIQNVEEKLEGYVKLEEDDSWDLKPGGCYYVERGGSSLIAFRLPEGISADKARRFMIVAAHSDSPTFKIKPQGEIYVEKHYTKLNVEKYGGMLMASWFDRPLSVAGRVLVETEEGAEIRLVNIDRDLLIIPSLAIHMNRKANENASYNAQIDMCPLFSDNAAPGQFGELIAEAAGVAPEQILDTDLYLYNRMPGTIWGSKDAFLSHRSLDDLQCAYALLEGFLGGNKDAAGTIPLFCIFNNEEVGSLTKQGADSDFMDSVLSRICGSLCGGIQGRPEDRSDRVRELKARMISAGFMVSADNGHAVHPNHPEMADPTNRPYMNGGVVIKYHANQKYTTDGLSGAVFRKILKKAGVPYQTYTNRSDIAGGSTLGNLSNRHISINTVDVGLAQLAMHSAYETAGVRDTEYMIRAIEAFYRTEIEVSGTVVRIHFA